MFQQKKTLKKVNGMWKCNTPRLKTALANKVNVDCLHNSSKCKKIVEIKLILSKTYINLLVLLFLNKSSIRQF